MRQFLALFLLSFLAIAVTPASAAGASGSSNSKSATSQSRSSVTDAQLESTIRTKLLKSKIGKDGFRFKVQRGVVTWEGNTAIGQQKGAATRMARTSGAAQVINNIKVASAAKDTPLRKAYLQP